VGTLSAANYDFPNLVNGILTVTKAHLTITADSKRKDRNAPNPTLTATISGFVNGDTASVVSGAPTLATTATTSSPPGTYPITGALGTLSATNYDFPNLVNGVLTVGQTAPADFDAIGRTVMAIFRPSSAQWYAFNPVTNSAHQIVNPNSSTGSFGATGLSDIPAPGDYDAIGRTEMAIFRPSIAQWYVFNPLTNTAHQVVNPNSPTGSFGATGLSDIPVETSISNLIKLGVIGSGGGFRAKGFTPFSGFTNLNVVTPSPGPTPTSSPSVAASAASLSLSVVIQRQPVPSGPLSSTPRKHTVLKELRAALATDRLLEAREKALERSASRDDERLKRSVWRAVRPGYVLPSLTPSVPGSLDHRQDSSTNRLGQVRPSIDKSTQVTGSVLGRALSKRCRRRLRDPQNPVSIEVTRLWRRT
jgi:hypothetical protein